ncbi:MAG: glycosyltransferase family 1 protein [Sphingomonadaceae bacterium]|nr:glycosyltransferase family 1 protein [Sphingomonadaceae bacterium]
MTAPTSPASKLRIAMFSGNYNYVRDGANQALNRLAGYALAKGAAVRVYSPTTATPAFAPTGDLVDVPAIPLPFGRGEYRLARGLPARVRADISDFAPNIFHVSAPDILGHRALTMARAAGIPVLASVHTLFETYPAYYGLGFMEAPLVALLRRFYNRCDALVAPSSEIADRLRGQGIDRPISVWSRGVDHARFHPDRRDNGWRRQYGIADDELVIGFLGRLVLEKGLDVFAAVCAELHRRGVHHRVLAIGDGPARDSFAADVPGVIFAGFQSGNDLGRAVASMDIFLNPSVTETFGNVTLEAMAAGVPVVAANATGARTLVADGVTGRLIAPRDISAYADAIAAYAADRALLAAAGAAGREASLAYHWDIINQKVIDEYCRVTAR